LHVTYKILGKEYTTPTGGIVLDQGAPDDPVAQGIEKMMAYYESISPLKKEWEGGGGPAAQAGRALLTKGLPLMAASLVGGPLGGVGATLGEAGQMMASTGAGPKGLSAGLQIVGGVLESAGEESGEGALAGATETTVGGDDVAWYDDVASYITGGEGVVPDVLESMIQTGMNYLGSAIFGDGSPSSSGGQASAQYGASPAQNIAQYGMLEAMPGVATTSAIPTGVSSSGALVYQAAAGRRMIPFQQGVWPGPGYKLVNRKASRGSPAHAAGMYWVPRRMTNPLNPRALARATRRSEGFMHFVKKHFTFPGRVAKPKYPFRARRRRSRKK
jgi:hypothetical protein